jgi:hypothetical protein
MQKLICNDLDLWRHMLSTKVVPPLPPTKEQISSIKAYCAKRLIRNFTWNSLLFTFLCVPGAYALAIHVSEMQARLVFHFLGGCGIAMTQYFIYRLMEDYDPLFNARQAFIEHSKDDLVQEAKFAAAIIALPVLRQYALNVETMGRNLLTVERECFVCLLDHELAEQKSLANQNSYLRLIAIPQRNVDLA